MNGNYMLGDVVLGNWTLTKLLGQGSFGKVFEAQREDFGMVYKAAIKIISVPYSSSEIANARAEGMDEESIVAYFHDVVQEVVGEFNLMSRLKGTTNVVSYEDHAVIAHDDGIGWDVIIRMELLTPMLEYMSSHTMTRMDVIQLGVDMCKALELCQRYNIIHRDIKPENIFVSDLGNYKLGDFGIARTIEKASGSLSKKGTYTYMAPEVYKEEPYGSNVDIYSLGIVMYRLLNHNRAPFLPQPPAPITHNDRESAIVRRVSGEPLPKPANSEGRLAEIVLKACAYAPGDRYTSPLLMRQELESISYNRMEDAVVNRGQDLLKVSKTAFQTASAETADEGTVYTTAVDDLTVLHGRNESTVVSDESRVPEKSAKTGTGRKQGGKKWVGAAVVLLLAVLSSLAFTIWRNGRKTEVTANQEISIAAPVETTLPETTLPETMPEETVMETQETVPVETVAETEPEIPNLYPDMATDEEGFVIVDNSGAAANKLCVLGYKVSDGRIINYPYTNSTVDSTNIGFSWAQTNEVTMTLIASWKDTDFTDQEITSQINTMVPIWRTSSLPVSHSPERIVNATFPMETTGKRYVLLLNLDSELNVVSHTVLKLGYLSSETDNQFPTAPLYPMEKYY